MDGGQILPHSYEKWSDEKCVLLTKLWTDRSVRLKDIIAEFDFEFSRNAIVGKAHRLGLPYRRDPSKASQPRKRKPRKRVGLANLRNCPSLKPEPLPIPTISDSEIPLEQRKQIFELTDQTCRWPVGDPGTPEFFFCGAVPIEGRPYCAGHMARAYMRITGKVGQARPDVTYFYRKRAASRVVLAAIGHREETNA